MGEATEMSWPDYVIVGIIGAAVGVGELVSRYERSPMRALGSVPAFAYVAVNAVASLAALYLIRVFDWKFGLSGDEQTVRAVRILAGGFGAMALLRSSLFVLRAGDSDVPVGPGAFLTAVTQAADAAVARKVEQRRIRAHATLARLAAETDSFKRLKESLPIYVLALCGDVSADDQAGLARQVTAMEASTMADRDKLFALAVTLINLAGEDAFATAVETLQSELVAESRGSDVDAERQKSEGS
jgi:hypothetical protein